MVAALLYVALAALPWGATAWLPAQTVDMERDRRIVVPMEGLWRFHTGDSPDEGADGVNQVQSPAWANADFDDSHWALMEGARSWSEQGYRNYGGMAWYRIKVKVPAHSKPLSLYLPNVATSYQVFVDGRLAGGFGAMPPHEMAMMPLRRVYELTQSGSASGRSLVIAIRVWHWPVVAATQGGGLSGGMLIGETSLIQAVNQLHVHEDAWFSVSTIALAMLEGLAGLASLAFFALRPEEREYLWFGVSLLLSAAARCFGTYATFHLTRLLAGNVTLDLLQVAFWFSQIAFYYRLLRGRRSWFFWSAIASVAGILLAVLTAAVAPELLPLPRWNEIFIMLSLPGAAWVLSLLIRRSMDGLPDARLLLLPVLLQQLGMLTSEALTIAGQEGWYHGSSAWFRAPSEWPFRFSVQDASDALFLLAMLAILIGRFTRTRRQQEHYERELEAARSVQQVLVPEEIPMVPGFAIASVYNPAQEVGGDFFQILPLPGGAVLMVIGDVSGKGLQAAMMVSLLVGTLRSLAEFTTDPAEILAGLNRRLHGRSGDGFTTCLAVRVDQEGELILANAGHLAPYLNGAEMAVEGGLPLGIVADAVYEDAFYELAQGDTITLVTDGVVEARNPTGQLFGFERTEQISSQPASAIAAAAKHFGQDDDITVLTLTRSAAPAYAV